jgi:hypothetical protein
VGQTLGPLARLLLRLAKTGTGQAFRRHREFVRAAKFEERPLGGRGRTDSNHIALPVTLLEDAGARESLKRSANEDHLETNVSHDLVVNPTQLDPG